MKRNLGLGKHICATIRVQMSKVGTICCSCLPDSFFPFIWGHHILLWGVLWIKQCPPKIHMVKPCPPVCQHLTVIRDRAFKEVCMCVCVCVCVCTRACTRMYVCKLLSHALCNPHGICPWDFPVKITGVCCHPLLQVNFPNPGIEPGFPLLQTDSLLYEPARKPLKKYN